MKKASKKKKKANKKASHLFSLALVVYLFFVFRTSLKTAVG